MIYLDNNATTQPAQGVVAAMLEALTVNWHNPSSVHRAGQAARRLVELARQSVATLIGCKPRSIIFTSGGTESIDLALRGVLAASPRRALLTSAIEHAAVRDLASSFEQARASGTVAARPVEVRRVELDKHGAITTESVARSLDDDVALVSLQWANNETGVVHPVHEIGELCRARGVPFHCDATQWVGKMPTVVAGAAHSVAGRDADQGGGMLAPLHADLLTFSPHKFHGPKGVGVLFARSGLAMRPQIHGTQELGRRGGTENVAGIVGAGVAAELAIEWLRDPTARAQLAGLRDRFELLVRQGMPDATIHGGRLSDDDATLPRLWNTSNIAFPRLEAEALLLLLSEKGVCASAGAACSSGSLEPSPVLLAMGIAPELAHGSVRFSLSRQTTEAEIEAAARCVIDCVNRLRASMPGEE